MTVAEYEEVVREIVESIVTAWGIPRDKIGHGRTNHRNGASGYSHQIDVSAERVKDLALIECKCWHTRVTLEKVLVLVGRIFDIKSTFPASTEIQEYIVSKKGNTKDAGQVAKYFGIETAQISTPQNFVFRYKDRWNAGLADSNGGNLKDDFKIGRGS
jgi:hypothetical protein